MSGPHGQSRIEDRAAADDGDVIGDRPAGALEVVTQA
jgi:hypothetical protein